MSRGFASKVKIETKYPVGTTFTIEWQDDNGGIDKYTVCDDSSAPSMGRISRQTPLGQALLTGKTAYCVEGKTINISLLEYELPLDYLDRIKEQTRQAYLKSVLVKLRKHINRAKINIAYLVYQQETPPLDDDDIRLALIWGKIRSKNFTEKDKLKTTDLDIKDTVLDNLNSHEKYLLGKMLSARAAEIAAAQFLKSINNKEIIDVSLEQLRDNSNYSNCWKQFDILSNGEPFDVKNSRRSRQNPDTYSDHTIPRFKYFRNQKVKIVGALSHYLQPNVLLNPNRYSGNRRTDIRILGFCDAKTIIDLKSFFKNPSFELGFQKYKKRRKYQLLPPWIFEFPDNFYPNRPNEIKEALALLRTEKALVDELKLSPISIYLAGGVNPTSELLERDWCAWEVDFFQTVLQGRQENGLSLPYLFLTILTHFLNTVQKAQANYHPHDYRKLVYFAEDKYYPLFIFDPLKTVDTLISALEILWRTNHRRISDYKIFKLRSAGILRGKTNDSSHWQSLIAYCGGWLPENKPCGKVPLVLGKNKHCQECGMLICECGFCSRDCGERKKRQVERFGIDPNAYYENPI